MRTIEESLQNILSQPVRTKGGEIATDTKTGEPLSAIDVMVQAVVKKATAGDIASVSFILNIQKNSSPDSEEAKRRHREKTAAIFERLKKEFEGDGLYIGQDTELQMLAEIAAIAHRLNDMMNTDDYQPVITEYTKKGVQTFVNPINKMRDDYIAQFNSQMEKMRDSALSRIYNKKRMKKEGMI